jgi:hypothetical protein
MELYYFDDCITYRIETCGNYIYIQNINNNDYICALIKHIEVNNEYWKELVLDIGFPNNVKTYVEKIIKLNAFS